MAGAPDSDALEIPLPTGGMNTDTSPSQLDPVEAVYIKNMLLTEPTQMRRRRGWKRSGTFYNRVTTPSTGFPMGVIPSPDRKKAIIYVAASGGTLDAMIQPYHFSGPDDTILTGYSKTSATYDTAVVDMSGGSFSLLADDSNWDQHLPQCRPVIYDNVTLWVEGYTGTGGTTTTKTGGVVNKTQYNRVRVWGGGTSDLTLHTPYEAVTATVGSTTVTVVTNYTPSLAGNILYFTSGSNVVYQYLIRNHTAGTNTMTLYRPYGYGDTSVPNLSATACFHVFDHRPHVVGSPPGAGCLTVYKDRIFVGRGVLYNQGSAGYSGYYANVVQWCYPGTWSKWPDSHYFFVDEEFSQPIMSMQGLKDTVLIWKRDKMYVLSGYDETTFQIDRFSDRIGCIHDLSVTTYEDRVFWCGERGIYSSNGSDIRNEANPQPGKGILVDYLPWIEKDAGAKDKYPNIFPVSHIIDDHFVLTINDSRSASTHTGEMWALNLKNGGWFKWGTSNASVPKQRVPHYFVKLNLKNYGIMSHYMVELDKVFREEDSTTAAADAKDQDYTSAGATEDNMVTFSIQFRDWIPAPSYTVRMREMAVDHSSFYVNGSQSARNSYKVTLAKDADLTSATTVEDVAARRQTSYNASTYYTDRFLTNTWQQEGSVFRLKITNSADAGLYCDSIKFYRVRVLLDKTRWSRVDNPVT